MTPEYEVHNLDENELPRRYEAIYIQDDVLVRVLVAQNNHATKGQKPVYRWFANAYAWTPGQQADDDYTHLCSLMRSELVVREVKSDGTADGDVWLEAARIDAEKLVGRADVYLRVLTAARKQGAKKARA